MYSIGGYRVPVMGFDDDVRRARLAVRHHLAGPARGDRAVEIAADLVALHATDPASVHLAVLARMRNGTPATVERALYDDRVRTPCMRLVTAHGSPCVALTDQPARLAG
jgi:hypothetical protein